MAEINPLAANPLKPLISKADDEFQFKSLYIIDYQYRHRWRWFYRNIASKLKKTSKN